MSALANWRCGTVLERSDDLLAYSTATFDTTRTYRYHLSREWGTGPRCVFVMLNPSTADAFTLDPTVRRCIAFAKRERCGTLHVLNAFALRSTDPKALRRATDPIGLLNDHFIKWYTRNASIVVAAWGTHGAYMDRGAEVAQRLQADGVYLQCLGLTAEGHPRHPLYVPGDAPLLPFASRVGAS